MLRRLSRIALIILIGTAVAVAAGLAWLRTSLPQTSGTMTLDGLRQAAEISRDHNGVPFITAQSRHDAYFALGVAHAQDRLWQMDFQRRLAAGRLSEILGNATLKSDRFMRTLGLYQLAQASYRRLDRETREAVDAYAKGVNSWLASRSGAWPVEFYVLRYRPEPWKPEDSLVWSRLMAMSLSRNWRSEILSARVKARLGANALETLFPPYPATAPRILAATSEIPENPLSDGSASNSWVLSGARTRSGKPLLANDPHLRFRAPGLWYLARIEAPGLTVSGATIPGMPFMLLGQNERIAWGFTTAGTDVQDIFIEQLDPENRERYLTPGGSSPFAVRREVILVRDAPDHVMEVRRTRHGPVISDLDPSLAALAGEGKVLALQTPALRTDDDSINALSALNRARDWTTFSRALSTWQSPHFNISYADKAGNIGMIAPARVPLRKSGDGSLPVPGWTGDHDWTGFVPYADLPRSFNPAGGQLVNANNPPAPKSFPYVIGKRITPGYRARRIKQMLAASPRHDAAAMGVLQNDRVSTMAQDLLPLLLKAAPAAPELEKALTLLDGWDGAMARDRPEPLIFTTWMLALNKRLFADELGPLYPEFAGLRPLAAKRVLNQEPKWCDDASTAASEDCGQAVGGALADALRDLSEKYGDDLTSWRWGDAHEARFDHPVMGRIPILGRLFNVRIAAHGGSYTVNRGRIRTSGSAPMASIHGAGYRAVYDLAGGSRSRVIVAPGQSGNLFSPHYDDLVSLWRDGGYINMPDAGTAGERLILKP